jgi:hypothetical protein
MVQRISFLEGKHKAKLIRGRNTPDERYPLRTFENT